MHKMSDFRVELKFTREFNRLQWKEKNPHCIWKELRPCDAFGLKLSQSKIGKKIAWKQCVSVSKNYECGFLLHGQKKYVNASVSKQDKKRGERRKNANSVKIKNFSSNNQSESQKKTSFKN